MSKFIRFTQFSTLTVSLLLAGTACADTLVQVFDPASQKEDSSIDWTQLGGDQTVLSTTSSVKTSQGLTGSVTFAGANSVISLVCKDAAPNANNCSWTGGTGFPVSSGLLWASNDANGGNGPVKLKFDNAILGVGAYVQNDLPGQFTVQLEVFNGATSLGAFTAVSNTAGDATYIGVREESGVNITSAVFSLTACATNCTDFALGTAHLDANASLVVLSSGALTFDPQLINTASPVQKVKLTNPGNALLTISSITASGDFAETDTCGSGVSPGQNCEIDVTFKPTSAGTKTGLIDIKDNSQDAEHTISLTGTGTQDLISPKSLDFGTVVTSASKKVTLMNAGTTVLHILGIAFGGDYPDQYSQTNDCGPAVNAGNSCTVTVTFTPGFLGSLPATLLISDDGSGGAPQQVSLKGVGSN